MKNGKKILALLLTLTLSLILGACSGDEGGTEKNDPNLGKYIGDQINILDWSPMSEVYQGENYIELQSGGKGVFCLDGESTKIKWNLNDAQLTITAEGQDCDATLQEGVIQINSFFGMDIPMTFAKEGVENTEKNSEAETE